MRKYKNSFIHINFLGKLSAKDNNNSWFRFLKEFNYFNFINIYKDLIRKILFNKTIVKRREILRNSNKRRTYINRCMNRRLDIDTLRNAFFNNNLFAYCNNAINKEEIIESLKENCSIEIKDILEYANNILKKEFLIFDNSHKFDDYIDWQYSFFEDFRWKLQKSENINLYPKNREVDVKYVWALNRHLFLTYLGFAYYYTKDDTYALEFKNIVSDWIDKNPPLLGINWVSGLEISIRLSSWIFSLIFFQQSKEINNNVFFKKIFKSMFQHGYYLKNFYTRRKFNHTVGELFGLCLFSKIFRDFKPFKKWENKVLKKFKQQILLQTRSDGSSIEQSINYHRFVLEFFILFLLIYPKILNREERDRIETMMEYLSYFIKPNSNLPLFGDIDDGKIFLLTDHLEKSYFDLINIGSILFNNGMFKYISSTISPLSILLLGKEGVERFNKLEIKKPHLFRSFIDAGHFIIRNDWTIESNYLFVDYGRFGALNAGHSHSNITNFILSYKGNDIIIDSGSYNYNISLEERNYFRSSKAHNIIMINSKNQAKIKSRFSWANKPKIKREMESSDSNIKLICYHNGYEKIIIKREIVTNINVDHLIIKDHVLFNETIDEENLNFIDLSYHFDKNVNLKLENDEININNLLLMSISSKNMFELNVQNSNYSPKYGFKLDNKVLNIHLKKPFITNQIVQINTEINPINGNQFNNSGEA